MTAAMNEINRQQNFPVSFIERLPRQDRSPWCYALALVCCMLVIVSRAIQVRSWV
jgi:mxaC protein